MGAEKNNDVKGLDKDSEILRLEEIVAKVERNEDLTLEKFNYFIDSFF